MNNHLQQKLGKYAAYMYVCVCVCVCVWYR